MMKYSYELSPDELTVGGYNLSIKNLAGQVLALTFFIADSFDMAEKIAEEGFLEWTTNRRPAQREKEDA